jgi:Alpha-2-macroglobulin family
MRFRFPLQASKWCRDFAVQPRDRAVLSVVLSIGSATETVAVAADAVAMPMAKMAIHGAMGGPMAAPAAAPMAQNFVDVNASAATLAVQGRSFAAVRKTASPDAPHVRSYFPEAIYINPEIVTDAKGNANVSIPIADSITIWRMAMLVSTPSGALGTGIARLKVFQDFFVDLDLPVTLTQGDRVSLPIAVYNYSGGPGQVSLKLQPEEWFSLDNDTSEKTVSVESGRVGASQLTINANRIGKFKLVLNAHMDGSAGRDDIVVREIEVVPNWSRIAR